MDLAGLGRWRRIGGRVGAFLCVLLVLVLLDALLGQFRKPFNVYQVLPGETVEVNGPLDEKVQGVQDLTYEAASPELTLTIEVVHRGYWLGGEMWRGRLKVSPQIQPGKYHLTVKVKNKTYPSPPLALVIKVHPDQISRQRSSLSLIERHTGLSPWRLALGMLLGVALAFGAVFMLSMQMDTLLAQEGQAEIYRVKAQEGYWEISFGLGAQHGLQPGDAVTIMDETGQTLGSGEVREVSPKDAVAVVSSTYEPKPGWLARVEGERRRTGGMG